MKNINKLLLIFTVLSRILFCSDAAQPSPPMPSQAHADALLKVNEPSPQNQFSACVAPLTYDNVLACVIRTGFALHVVDLRNEATDIGIKKIQETFFSEARKLPEMCQKEFDSEWFLHYFYNELTKDKDGGIWKKKMNDLNAEREIVLESVYSACASTLKAISSYDYMQSNSLGLFFDPAGLVYDGDTYNRRVLSRMNRSLLYPPAGFVYVSPPPYSGERERLAPTDIIYLRTTYHDSVELAHHLLCIGSEFERKGLFQKLNFKGEACCFMLYQRISYFFKQEFEYILPLGNDEQQRFDKYMNSWRGQPVLFANARDSYNSSLLIQKQEILRLWCSELEILQNKLEGSDKYMYLRLKTPS